MREISTAMFLRIQSDIYPIPRFQKSVILYTHANLKLKTSVYQKLNTPIYCIPKNPAKLSSGGCLCSRSGRGWGIGIEEGKREADFSYSFPSVSFTLSHFSPSPAPLPFFKPVTHDMQGKAQRERNRKR